MKKFLTLLLTVALTATLAITGTVAYLTDVDSEVNVATVGNVQIDQIELRRPDTFVDAAGILKHTGTLTGNELIPFKQGEKLYPAYPKNNAATDYSAEPTDLLYWGPYVTATGAGNGLWNPDKLVGALDKFVFVQNTGSSDCYYRTWFAFECPEGMEYSVGADKEFMMNVNGHSLFDWEKVGYEEIDGVRYLIECATYTAKLAPGETSRPSLLQVVMTHNADSADVQKLGPSYEILAYTQACQTENLPDAKTALEVAFGTDHPWVNTVLVNTNNPEELKTALTSGKDVIINTDIVEITDPAFDGNGTTVTLAGVGDGSYGYLGFGSAAGQDATVENLTATGSGFVEVGHYGQAGGTYTVKNLTVKDMNATLTAVNGTDKLAAAFAHYGNATLEDCTMTGTTTAADGFTAYDAGFVNKTNTTIDGGEYGSIYVFSQAHVTINDAEVGSITSSAITASNLGMLTIGSGTHVGTITITCADKYTPALTIEAGATVDKIIYKGTEYTQAEWLARP